MEPSMLDYLSLCPVRQMLFILISVEGINPWLPRDIKEFESIVNKIAFWKTERDSREADIKSFA